jgi:hypothetical protein
MECNFTLPHPLAESNTLFPYRPRFEFARETSNLHLSSRRAAAFIGNFALNMLHFALLPFSPFPPSKWDGQK